MGPAGAPRGPAPAAPAGYALEAARRALGRDWPDAIRVREVTADAVVTEPVAAVSLALVVARDGAQDVANVLPAAARLGTALARTYREVDRLPPLALERVWRDEAEPSRWWWTPFAEEPPLGEAEQLRRFGALLFEVLAGRPPPGELIGLRPQVSRIIQTLLGGGGGSLDAVSAELADLGVTRGGSAAAAGSAAALTTPTSQRRVGDQLGAYRLLARLDGGGMGEVFRARHQDLEREAALKVLHPRLAGDRAMVERFLREAQLVNQIRHPHIVEVYDFVDGPADVYCLMELLDGVTIGRLADTEGPLPVARACRLVAQACEALAAAHAAGVIHRDVKPSNIFVTQRDGADFVKLLDFGIAKLLGPTDGDRALTRSGMVLGTPMYMAPEQGLAKEVDGRADVYAIGAVLYELLTGRTLYGEPAPLRLPRRSASGERLPAALRTALAAAIALDASARPDAAELARHLVQAARPARALPVALVAAVGIAVGVGAVVLGRAPAVVELASPARALPAVAASPELRATPAELPATVPRSVAPAASPPPADIPGAPPPASGPAVRRNPTTGAHDADSVPRRPAARRASALEPRLRRFEREYRGLLARHGEAALSLIEREVFRGAIPDLRADDEPRARAALEAAEGALRAARARLEPGGR